MSFEKNRKHPRVSVLAGVILYENQDRTKGFSGFILDLSPGGMNIYTKSDINDFGDILFEIKTKNKTFQITGRIKRKKKYGDYCNYGIEFTETDNSKVIFNEITDSDRI